MGIRHFAIDGAFAGHLLPRLQSGRDGNVFRNYRNNLSLGLLRVLYNSLGSSNQLLGLISRGLFQA
jgi:hypothetical protein